MHGATKMTKNELGLQITALDQILRVDPSTGLLFWKERTCDSFAGDHARASHSANHWNVLRSGKAALNFTTALGYKSGNIGGKFFFAHRVVFALVHRRWPEDLIDHINGDRSDNRPANLRDSSHLENQRNKKRPITNTSGGVGVQWIADRRQWRAVIKVGGRAKHLGMFCTLSEAAAARKIAETENGFHANHGR